MALAPPIPASWNRTTSSLPIESSLDCQELKRKPSSAFTIGREGIAPARVRSPLNLNCGSRNVQCINGQITPTSPDDSPVDQNEANLLLAPPSHQLLQQAWGAEGANSSGEKLAHRIAFGLPKSLRSPIKFDVDVEIRHVEPGEDVAEPGGESHVEQSTDNISLESLNPEIDRPRRRLSYGEPLKLIDAASNERVKGFRVSLPKPKWPVDRDCGSWIDDTIKARAGRPFHSEPSRKKSRLWLELAEDEVDDKIQEAVRPTQVDSFARTDSR